MAKSLWDEGYSQRGTLSFRFMYLKILVHPVFVNLNFHMPMIVDLSHPLVMLTGENGSGKSTLLHSIYYALRGGEGRELHL